MEEIIDVCPFESELKTEIDYSCLEKGCKSTFKRISNLQLHLVKHHGVGSLVSRPKGVVLRFFCPKQDCVYNINHKKRKSFAQKRFLKQHYLKMHTSKDYICNKCGLQNSIASAHERHLKSCGMKYECGACGWEYNSNESLIVHLMRKHPQIHEAYLKNKAESKNKLNKVVDIKKNIESSHDFGKINTKVTNSNKKRYLKLCDAINFDHNYTKSFRSEGSIANDNVIFVNIYNDMNEGNEKYQLAFPTKCNPTHAIVPINLLNGEFSKQHNPEMKNIMTNREILTNPEKSADISNSMSQFTQTPLKCSKKHEFPATNKSSVETQTFNRLWNPLNKNKVKQKNACTQSFVVKKSGINPSNSSLKVVKNPKKCKVDKNVNTCSVSRRLRKQNGSKKNQSEVNPSVSNTDLFKNFENRLKTLIKSKILTNEDALEDNSVIDEHSNVFLSNSVPKPICNSNSMDFNCQFDCEDLATQSSNIETQTSLDELLYSNTPKCDEMQDDIFSELIHLSDTQTQTTWPLNCDTKENCKAERFEVIVSNSSDVKSQSSMDQLLFPSEFDEDDILSDLVYGPNRDCKIDVTVPQFSDIETQTALDELLYANTPKCDDIQDDIFTKCIHLSDIQTQTMWPLSCDQKNDIDSKDGTVLISAETQTMDDNPFSNYNYDDKNSLFGSSHFCFKETQTCSKSLDAKHIDDMDLSNHSSNPSEFLTKNAPCLLPSAETQTQFSFDDSQFFKRKSDVLLSYCTTETQTCFEDAYLGDV